METTVLKLKFIRKSTFYALLALLFVVILYSCNSDDSNNARLIVTLTDSPGDYDAVNIDIKSLEVHRSPGEQQTGWIELGNTNAAVYNLLDFTNGIEVVLADTEFPTGLISQLRLVLGDNSSVEINGETIAIKVPSGQESGLKLLINETLLEGITYTFKLDFDAARSVVKGGQSGNFNLRPVIKVITEATSGAIQGVVQPASENVAVYAMQGQDTLGTSYAIENVSDYIIGGLDPGTYSVVFDPGEMSALQPLIVDDVNVIIGEITQMDAVELQ